MVNTTDVLVTFFVGPFNDTFYEVGCRRVMDSNLDESVSFEDDVPPRELLGWTEVPMFEFKRLRTMLATSFPVTVFDSRSVFCGGVIAQTTH